MKGGTPAAAAAGVAASKASNVSAGSQAGAFAALLFGGILLVAAAKGDSIRNVLSGIASPIRPLTSPIPSSFASSKASGAAQSKGASAQPSGELPLTRSAAKALRGVGNFEGQDVALWIIPYLRYARAHGWKGKVESGYRSFAEQSAIYNSGVRPAAEPGTSNHEGKQFPRGAIDVTDAEELARILSTIPGGSLLKWAGASDPVHFSFPHGGGY